MSKITATSITVPNVKVNGNVISVKFEHGSRQNIVVCSSRNQLPIVVSAMSNGKFAATIGREIQAERVVRKHPARAFASAAKLAWF